MYVRHPTVRRGAEGIKREGLRSTHPRILRAVNSITSVARLPTGARGGISALPVNFCVARGRGAHNLIYRDEDRSIKPACAEVQTCFNQGDVWPSTRSRAWVSGFIWRRRHALYSGL